MDLFEFLYKKKIKKFKKNVVHVWNGTDTMCHMWSTGGIKNKEIFEISNEYPDDTDREICKMCADNLENLVNIVKDAKQKRS